MLGGSLDSIVDPATDRSCDSVSDGFAVEFVHSLDVESGVLYDAAQPSPICRSIQFTTKLTWAVRVTTRGRSRSWSVVEVVAVMPLSCRSAIAMPFMRCYGHSVAYSQISSQKQSAKWWSATMSGRVVVPIVPQSFCDFISRCPSV